MSDLSFLFSSLFLFFSFVLFLSLFFFFFFWSFFSTLHLFLRNAHVSVFGSPVTSQKVSLAAILKLCGPFGTPVFPSSVGLVGNNTILDELYYPVRGDIRTEGAFQCYDDSWKHFVLME